MNEIKNIFETNAKTTETEQLILPAFQLTTQNLKLVIINFISLIFLHKFIKKKKQRLEVDEGFFKLI